MKKLVFLLIAETCAGGLMAAVPAPDTLIAHRGESVDAPENTLHAYRTAVSRGFGFECDVYLSADKRVFTFHDGDLTRTTGGACTSRCEKASWEETISKVDVGGWGKWKGSKFSPTRPALLEEVLELAVDGRQIYVELKSGPEIVPYVKAIFAKQTKATPKNVLFICFDPDNCAALKRQMPEYRVYWLTGARFWWGSEEGQVVTTDKILSVLRKTKADGVDCQFDRSVVTADFIKRIRQAGYEFHAWTIDDLADTLLAFERGVQTVTTNCAKKQHDAFKRRSDKDLAELAAADVARPVRPAGVNGQPFWNANAIWFLYPPSFDFQKVAGATEYIFRVTDSKGTCHYMYEKEPTASLAKIWGKLPSGHVSVECRACKPGPHTLKIHYRSFWKMPAYRPGSYPKAPRSYAEAAEKGFEYLLNLPHMKKLAETGKPDPSYRLSCYPTKMNAATALAMVKYAERNPARREVALKLAKAAADHLISIAQPAGAPLAHFTPTYQGASLTEASIVGLNMLVHPAESACAYLAVYGVTKEAKYLEEAKAVAETYLKLQGADGTWPMKVRESDGKPTAPNRLHPVSVMDMFDRLYAVTGDRRYQEAADRAFGFFERGPMKDWNWEGQFEDVAPSGKYLNLTKHPACSIAMRLVRRWPDDPVRIAQAREILRFAEDQFVVWAQPWKVEKGRTAKDWGKGSLEFSDWRVVPAVVEQYYYREAVDASASKLISTYLALYKATGNPLDLAKARTLGDSCVRIQCDDGRIQTIWNRAYGDDPQQDWMNCMVSTLLRLYELSEMK